MAMLEYDERLFDTVFNKCLLQFGTDCTLTKVLGSLIKQVGTLWQVGAISVSNEHFISNLIKQKLFSIIDQIMLPSEKEGVNSYILYLPAGELHELGLLYLYYYLKKGGHRVIYLGQSVPLAYLKEAALRTNINRFVSIFTSSPRLEDVDEYFHQLQECLPPEQYHFFLTGMQCSNIEKVKKHTRNVTVLPDLETLIKHLK
ncbi:MAG: hypothetical protein U5L96_02565 [Owenweeksia sp.]|nr:hypothetical protein [Owenweeksia sp.]